MMEVENVLKKRINAEVTRGEQMHQFIDQLFPFCRSITGNGVRQTLKHVRKMIPIEIREVPTGTKVFDWQIPREWNIRDAYIKNRKGERIIDFAKSNLHVLNYSAPVNGIVSLSELKKHLWTLPSRPDWIPYRTSYYHQEWGFCVSYNQYKQLQDDDYEVCIDSTLEKGSLTYGELFIEGESSEEVLISTHICHPSLCNDNLSGISVAAFLAKELEQRSLRYSYRILFIPGTIGAITWLASNESRIKNIKHGLVAALLGSGNGFVYKKSRRGVAEIDQVVEATLINKGAEYKIIDFSPDGYDERQFCSPGINLPVGSLTRTRNNEYPEYHTSADDRKLVKPETLESSLQMYLDVIAMLDSNRKYRNLNPKCEPQLGKRGLYDEPLNGNAEFQKAVLWTLNLSDGKHSLLDISKRSGINFNMVCRAAEKLVIHQLLDAA
jgi:aminopeptidase-like protein